MSYILKTLYQFYQLTLFFPPPPPPLSSEYLLILCSTMIGVSNLNQKQYVQCDYVSNHEPVGKMGWEGGGGGMVSVET